MNIYDNDPVRLRTLAEEYTSLGFVTKITDNRLTVVSPTKRKQRKPRRNVTRSDND